MRWTRMTESGGEHGKPHSPKNRGGGLQAYCEIENRVATGVQSYRSLLALEVTANTNASECILTVDNEF